MTNNINITCDTNCIDCKYYHPCESTIKLDEQTRDFWLEERDKYDDYELETNMYYEEYQ